MYMGWSPQLVHDATGVSMLMPGIRTVVADNEDFSRRELRLLLAAEPGINVVGECGVGAQTINTVRNLKPDLLLVDVHLPGTDGFHVLSDLPPSDRPLVIVTSAQEKHALRAFEAGALDYLVKPLSRHRLHAALERTRSEILKHQDRQLTQRLLTLLTKPEPRPDRRLIVKSGGKVILLSMDEIDWIEAAANYIKLQTGGQSHLMREAIGRIESRLDPNLFVRIHRSIIVNVQRIKELHPCNRGEYIVVLKDGKELSCSRSYRSRLQERLIA